MAVLLVACDAHRDFPDTAMKPCHILCTDGNVMSYADYEKSGKHRNDGEPDKRTQHQCEHRL